MGESLTLWTVRAAVVLYVAALAMRWSDGPSTSRTDVVSERKRVTVLGWSRLFWTAGYLCFILHVLAAFHYYHAWSHQAAWDSTARQTQELTGIASGAGLYANYVFLLVWGSDVIWWWTAPAPYLRRPVFLEWVVHLFLGFITFNATVIFAAGVSRWMGLIAVLVLAGCSLRRYRSKVFVQ